MVENTTDEQRTSFNSSYFERRHAYEKETCSNFQIVAFCLAPTDEFLNKIKSRQKRWAKKLLKIKSKNELSLQTDVRRLIKRIDRMKISIDEIPLEKLLEFDDKPLNRFEMRLVRSFPPSKEFQETLKSSHEIYQRYQMSIHHDSKDECSFSQFKRFLCESTLDEKSSPAPSCGFGCFHLQYYLNGKIIGCSVIDILPQGVSSVYFYYDPDFSFLRLGVYSALRFVTHCSLVVVKQKKRDWRRFSSLSQGIGTNKTFDSRSSNNPILLSWILCSFVCKNALQSGFFDSKEIEERRMFL